MGPLRDPFALQHEVRTEKFLQLFQAHAIGRPRFVVVRIGEKDREQFSLRLQEPDDRVNVVLTQPRIDCAKAGMLENPIELVIELRRQIEQISQQIFLVCDPRGATSPS